LSWFFIGYWIKAGLDIYPGPFLFIKIKDQSTKFQIMDNEKKNPGSDNVELEKSKSHIIVEIIEYVPNSVVIKTIIKKSTGNISIMSFDSGEGLTEKTSPFDTFAQIIEGMAEIVIDNETILLQSGQGTIIPAHSPNFIKPNGRFKMILTTIKSGYE
jgi:mannose-6-phosphate isomerase-like protein (cupin superfamily)